MPQLYWIIPLESGHISNELPSGPPGHPGGGPMPGYGGARPVDPGYGRPAWGPVDPGWGGGWGGGGHPSQGLPGGGHISTGPVWGGHPSTGPVYPPGLHPSQDLPGAPAHPDQGLPEGVEIWPPPPSASTKPIEPGEGLHPSNPIELPAPPEGTTVLVWISGVGYRYVTIGQAEPKDE